MLKWPAHERPRERLMTVGEEALTDSELLAIILGKGTKGKSVLHLSQDLLSSYGSLRSLLNASIYKLMEMKGIGEAKAVQLKALFALCKRAHRPDFVMRYPLSDAFHAFVYIREKFPEPNREQFLVILRDARGAAFHYKRIALGKINCVGLEPREVFSYALDHEAVSMILCHNHPTGNATPSTCDIELTKKLAQSAAIMGIPLDDHLIVGKLDYTSFYEQGYLKKRKIY
ncbi:MAG TPA: DNA repair protein RadC [Chlamydiales bacterium]|nr:DNA repair protein RadC [Chlamydiales bacterium]